jgi:hypothetical protein
MEQGFPSVIYRETFGLPGNRIGLPLFEVDEGTAYDLPNEWSSAATHWGLLQFALLGASDDRPEAGSHIPSSQRR